MKIYRLLLSIIFLVAMTSAAFAQQRMSGTVIDVTDGKTVVIELGTKNKVTAQLDHIEIPEPEQPLSETVKVHLRNMLLGKNVEFFAREVLKTKFVGKMFLGEVDVSQQMLRDGAAWYAVLDKDRQNPAEREKYQIVESQAKLEKRGVWGIQNLKTAWEFRAEKAKTEQIGQIKQAAFVEDENQVVLPKVKPQPKAVSQPTIWADIRGNNPKTYLGIDGLFNGTNPQSGIEYIYTNESDLTLKTKARSIEKLQIATVYAYKGSSKIIEKNAYFIGILSTSKQFEFVKKTPLTIQIGNQQTAAKPLMRFYADSDKFMQELLVYQVDAATLEKLHKAENVSLKLGTIGLTVNTQSKTLISKLMKVTN